MFIAEVAIRCKVFRRAAIHDHDYAKERIVEDLEAVLVYQAERRSGGSTVPRP